MTDKDQAQAEYDAAAAEGMASENTSAYDAVDALGTVLLAEFAQATVARQETEQRWLKDLRQYRGQYEPEVEESIGPHRSRAYVRATRVKVKTVNARVSDLLFPSNSDRNWTAEPTPQPSLDQETKAEIHRQMADALKARPTQKQLEAAYKSYVEAAAKRMTQIIDDQLAESRYKEVARHVLHSGHLYGTGILKAPLVERKVRTKYVRKGRKWVLKEEIYFVPFVDHVPLWRFYPDMSATELRDCRYTYEEHLLTRAALAKLASNRSYKGQVIRDYIRAHPKGMRTNRHFDNEIRSIGERTSSQIKDDGQYSVLERWGYIDGELLASAGVTVADERLHETFFANVWLLPNGEVIKIVLQPLRGVTWPYHLYYADKDETSIFGDGFASIMRDDQTMINAATRMVLDNAALTAGPQFEANMDLLSASERAEDMFPFKIWKRNGKDPASPAIRVLNLPTGLEDLFPIVNMFKENADEVTAIPRYMQGENATNGAAGTASGMSMLMANASIVMKDLITNYDEGVTRTFIEALYRWNMQFNPDQACKGDFDIKARGTASLMAKEIRAQQLDNFANTTANPMDAPYIKREELMRQRAEAHDLVSVVKTEEEVQAETSDEGVQQQAQLKQKLDQLAVQKAELEVQKLQAEIKRLDADATRLDAVAVKTNVDAAYAGMQAGGVATERPQIAPAGDAILKSAGFKDQTPQQGTPAAQGDAPAQVPPAQDAQPQGGTVGAQVGEMAGVHTAAIEAQP